MIRDPVDLRFLVGFCLVGLHLFGGGGGVWLISDVRRFYFFFFCVFLVGGGWGFG